MAKTFKIPEIERPEEFYKILHAVADQASPDIVKAFYRTIESARLGIPVDKIARYLKVYNLDQAIEAINWEQVVNTELTPEVRKTLRAVYEAAGEAPGGLPGKIELDFDIVNPRAIDYIKNEVGLLITNVNAETVAAVRDSIRSGFENGKGPRVMAEEIKEYIGLNRKQAGAFLRFKDDLIAKGIPEKRLQTLASNYYRRLQKERALLIARTETINAASNGYREQLIQASEQGLLDAVKWEIQWLVTPDDRLCPLCRQMSGKRREINGTYQSGPGAGKKCPTLHPRCRCSERTIRKASKASFKSTPVAAPELPTPEKIGPEVMFSKTPRTSQAFADKVKGYVDKLPEKVKQTLVDHDVVVRTGELISDIDPSLEGVHPRGWPRGFTQDAVEGCYVHGKRNVYVTENTKRYKKIAPNDRVGATVNHETGHAVFDARGFKDNHELTMRYRVDRGAMAKELRRQMSYFLQAQGRGMNEAFAECFAIIAGESTTSLEVMTKTFPRVLEFARRIFSE